MPKKIEVAATETVEGSRYPAPYDEPCKNRLRRVLGDAASLTQFGVNLTRLPPGTCSSQRHWHTVEDEFVFVLEGTVILVTDSGEEVLNAGDCAGFKAGSTDGHHLQNRSDRDALILEVGTRRPNEDEAFYSDIDLFSRRVIGWAMHPHMTAQLVTDALLMALWRRGPLKTLLHHSDQGSQYTSEPFQKLLSEHGITCSMSRNGDCWDNAVMESFFSTLKTERTSRKHYRTRNEARADVFDYIERFFNPRRRHSTLGYLSPADYERAHSPRVKDSGGQSF